MSSSSIPDSTKLRLQLAAQLVSQGNGNELLDSDYQKALARASWMMNQVDPERQVGIATYQLFLPDELMSSDELAKYLTKLGVSGMASKTTVNNFIKLVVDSVEKASKAATSCSMSFTQAALKRVVSNIVKLPTYNSRVYDTQDLDSVVKSLEVALENHGKLPQSSGAIPNQPRLCDADLPEIYETTDDFIIYMRPKKEELEHFVAKLESNDVVGLNNKPGKWLDQLAKFKESSAKAHMLCRPHQLFLCATVLEYLGCFSQANNPLRVRVTADSWKSQEVRLEGVNHSFLHPRIFPEFYKFYNSK